MSENSGSTFRLRYWERSWFPMAVFFMLAMVYLVNRSPYVGFNDGLSFLFEADAGWSPFTNATSHFLYNNFQHVLVEGFFFLPAVFVLTMFSVMCAMLALWRIFQIAQLLVGSMAIVALMPVMILGLSFTFWQQSEIIEVYAFNNFVFLSFFYFALKDLLRGRRKHYLLVSALLGLALLTHIQHLLALPFFLYYLFSKSTLKAGEKVLGAGLVAGLFGILLLPPLLGDTNSISSIFVDNEFGAAVTSFSIAGLGKGILMGMGYLMYNFHMFLLFILHGWYVMYKERRSLFYILLLLFLPYFGFAAKYSVADNHVFYLISYCVFVLPCVYSFFELAPRLMKHLSWMLPVLMLMSPMLYGGAALLGRKVPQLAEYHQEKIYKGGVTHLLWPGKSMARDPLFLAWQVYHKGGAIDTAPWLEWNYESAIRYLKLKGQLADYGEGHPEN